ncbi:Stonustoxin subunit alpha [Dissostichus eleginoides]|uniref:Stonustoxin subunit alpha n=1 Tax=Dissostichus eleginoides TaxID=100907 RepID=A0AAD9B955_DISEL|nr:Stonustoxin subunit alpha [Dissostichus eleginoides]
MDSEVSGTMEVAALGRPFSLGMLYDCRKDSLVPGMSLWDRDDLKNHIGERPQSYNDCDIVASESIEDKSKALNVEASLKASFLGGLVEGKGSLKMEDKDKANDTKLSCRFFGDFLIPKPPTSFQDAIEVYQSLPKLLGANGENAVPVKVWLLPLTCLDSTAAKLVRQISIGLVQESQSVLEDFSDLEMRFNDALRTQTAQQFPQIENKLKTFKQMCSQFKLEFQQTLAKKLPSIRGGGEEEAVLAEELRKTCSSPFNSKDLNEWMDCKEREISILKSYTNKMKNTQIVPRENDLHEEILKAEQAVCFVFTSLGSDEPYLSTLSNYLKETPKPDDAQDPHPPDLEKEQWYLTNKVAETLRNKAKLFSDFAEANKENKNITFLTVGLTNETQKGASIYLYTDGFSVNENFEPPSKPATVTGSDFNHNSVTLKISPPRFGAEDISSYSVEYCVSGEDGWKQETASKAEEVTVSGLSPNTEYMFRCRAETPVGVGPANEVSGSIKTLPCRPPGKPNVESTSREIYVSWEKPAELGQDVHVLSYIVEYAKPDQQVKEEDLHWEQMMARAERAIISGLQPETEYAVRVRCDCGAAGRSKESIAVNVRTTKPTHLTESLKSKDCDYAFGEVDGQRVKVIDTPGLFDTRFDEKKNRNNIVQSICFASPGPHVFLVVIGLGRFTEEEKQSVQKIQEIFGEQADRYSMVLFTHGDLLVGKPIEEFIEESEDLQEPVARCNGLYHVFNNALKDRSQQGRYKLVKEKWRRRGGEKEKGGKAESSSQKKNGGDEENERRGGKEENERRAGKEENERRGGKEKNERRGGKEENERRAGKEEDERRGGKDGQRGSREK